MAHCVHTFLPFTAWGWLSERTLKLNGSACPRLLERRVQQSF